MTGDSIRNSCDVLDCWTWLLVGNNVIYIQQKYQYTATTRDFQMVPMVFVDRRTENDRIYNFQEKNWDRPFIFLRENLH